MISLAGKVLIAIAPSLIIIIVSVKLIIWVVVKVLLVIVSPLVQILLNVLLNFVNRVSKMLICYELELIVKDFFPIKIVKPTDLSIDLAQFLLFFRCSHQSVVNIIYNYYIWAIFDAQFWKSILTSVFFD